MIDKFESNMCSARLMPDARELTSISFLWRSVLAQAVRDIYAGKVNERAEVIRWLKTTDFETVCEYADVEASSMREQIAYLAAMPQELSRKYGKKLRDKIVGYAVSVP